MECSKETSPFTVIGSSASGITNNSSTPRYYEWINLRNPLGQHGHTGQPYSLAFRVKFWVPAHLILQESVRNIFYMQAKSDLLDGRLRAPDWETAARLGALLAQGDEIKFDPNALNCDHDSIDMQSSHSNFTVSASSASTSINVASAAPAAAASSADRTTSASIPIEGNHAHSDGHSDNAYTDDDCSSISSTSDMTAVGCVSLGSLSSHKDSMSKSKKRKLSKQRLSVDEGDESDNDIGDVRDYSPLHVYEDYVIQIEDDLGRVPDDFLRKIAQEHAKLVKTPPKSAKYWLLQSIFKLSGFGEETFSGIRVSASSTGHPTPSLSRNRSIDATGDWSDYVRARANSSCHDNNTAHRCDISVGPHGLLITTPDEQTR